MDWYLIQCNYDNKWALLFFRTTESSLGDTWCSSVIKVKRWPVLTINETGGTVQQGRLIMDIKASSG